VTEWVGFNVPLDTKPVIFGDESFRTIDCTGTDNQKQGNTTLYTSETQKTNSKTCPSWHKKALVWYTFYDLWPGNRVAVSYKPRARTQLGSVQWRNKNLLRDVIVRQQHNHYNNIQTKYSKNTQNDQNTSPTEKKKNWCTTMEEVLQWSFTTSGQLSEWVLFLQMRSPRKKRSSTVTNPTEIL